MVCLPDGQKKKLISKVAVDLMLQRLEIQVSVRMSANTPLDPKLMLDLIKAEQNKVAEMIDPTIINHL